MLPEFIRPGYSLRCADSSKVDLEPDSLDVGFSDPPYELGLDIAGDQPGETAHWAVPAMLSPLKPGAPLLLWNAESTADTWIEHLQYNGATVHGRIIWDKGPYFTRRAKELLLIATKGPTLVTYNDDEATTWSCPTVRDEERRENHLTPKPVSLQRRALRRFAPLGARVLDMFAGGGDIAVAALMLGFGYEGFELVPDHAASAVERLERIAVAQSRIALQRRSAA